MSKLSQTVGSRRLLLNAVNRYPTLLQEKCEEAGVIGTGETMTWASPLHADGGVEYRDAAALRKLGVADTLARPLSAYWPARGPVWDGLATTTSGRRILVEAKAHISELASPGTKASPASRELIEQSLHRARRFYARRSKAEWTSTFYQYANRLAFQYFLRELNGVDSRLVFLAFLNAEEVGGPSTAEEWYGATRLLHTVLGLPSSLESYGVFHIYVNARDLN